jgi:hypothetical protein
MATLTQVQTLQMPPEHIELESQIRALQSLGVPAVSEERLQPIVSRVAQEALQSLVIAAGMRTFLQAPSLALAARMITMEKDRRLVQTDRDGEVVRVLRTLEATNIGKEALLRVVQSISSQFNRNLVTFIGQRPSLPELYQATMLFAA